MENFESQEKNRLDELKESIRNAPERIEAEFQRTQNTWLECFGGSIFVVETYLASPKLQTLLSPEQHQKALDKIEELKNRHFELKAQYPDKDTIPPEEIKKELLDKLDVIS